MRIDVVIVLAVILMVGRRYKYGVQVDGLHLQPFQIAELIPDSFNITAVKPSHIHCGRKFIPVPDPFHRFPDINVFIRLHIIGRISVAEPST